MINTQIVPVSNTVIIKDSDLEGTYSTQTIREMFRRFSTERKRHLGYLDLVGRITLKWRSKEIPQYRLDSNNSGSGPHAVLV
jgi:hypothetical protein